MNLGIYYTHPLIMIYTFNNFNENGAASEILPLKSKLIQADTGNSASGSSYVLAKY